MVKGLEEYRDSNLPKLSGRRIEHEDLGFGPGGRAAMERAAEEEAGFNADGSVFDEIVKKQRKFRLFGHSDAVFSLSISPDKKYIISGSYDETIRLWSIYTKSSLVVYKGHFSPVLSVKFSPFS